MLTDRAGASDKPSNAPQVRSERDRTLGVVAQEARCLIARAAQQASVTPGRVAVVDVASDILERDGARVTGLRVIKDCLVLLVVKLVLGLDPRRSPLFGVPTPGAP